MITLGQRFSNLGSRPFEGRQILKLRYFWEFIHEISQYRSFLYMIFSHLEGCKRVGKFLKTMFGVTSIKSLITPALNGFTVLVTWKPRILSRGRFVMKQNPSRRH